MRGAFSFSGSTVQRSLTLDTSFSTIGVEGDIHMSTSSGRFHPPNSPSMTAKEKHLAAVRRLEEPLLCDCGDRAAINPENTLQFVYPNKHEVSAKCMCWNIELYVHVLMSFYLVFRCFQWRSVVSRSGCMVLRTNSQKNLQRQSKRRKKG